MKAAGLALAALLLAPAVASFPLAPSDDPVARALDYLRSRQSGAGDVAGFDVSQWTAMAVAAAEQDPRTWRTEGGVDLCAYLAAASVQLDAERATDLEKYVLAAIACGGDPRTFGGQDHVALLLALQRDRQLGDPAALNDDFWGVVALAAAGLGGHGAVQNSTQYILDHQRPDGGWGGATTGGSDVDNTAAALFALASVGFPPSGPVVAARDYLHGAQREDGGFGAPVSNAASTAWSIAAVSVLGEDASSAEWTNGGVSAATFLLGLQDGDGAFRWTAGARLSPEWMTAYATVALLGRWYPVARVASSADGTPPQVGIEQPVEGATLPASAVEVSGWASDDQGLVQVRARAGTGPWTPCLGLTQWTCRLNLSAGPWTLQVQAVDAGGNAASAWVHLTAADAEGGNEPSGGTDAAAGEPASAGAINPLLLAVLLGAVSVIAFLAYRRRAVRQERR